jgi:hypothetical protein
MRLAPQLLPGLVAVLAAALLGGCAENRGTPGVLIGTWHQVRGADGASLAISDPTPTGFLAIGDSDVVCDLPGVPRGTAGIVGVMGGDAAGGAVVLTLDNGERLYLTHARDASAYPVGDAQVLIEADHLDVHLVRIDASGAEQDALRVRLWSDASVAAAALVRGQRDQLARPAGAPASSGAVLAGVQGPPVAPPDPAARPGAGAATVARPAPALVPAPDRSASTASPGFLDRLAALQDPYLLATARSMVHGSGGGDLGWDYDQLAQQVRLDLLGLLTAARAGDGAALATATARQQSLASLDRSYADWLTSHP